MRIRNNKKGFTLAELLIVVAIIAVLVAIAIPVFTAQLNKSQLATDTSNLRADIAEQIAKALANGTTDDEGKVTITLSYTPTYCDIDGGDDYGEAVTLTHKKDSTLTQEIPLDDNVKLGS